MVNSSDMLRELWFRMSQGHGGCETSHPGHRRRVMDNPDADFFWVMMLIIIIVMLIYWVINGGDLDGMGSSCI